MGGFFLKVQTVLPLSPHSEQRKQWTYIQSVNPKYVYTGGCGFEYHLVLCTCFCDNCVQFYYFYEVLSCCCYNYDCDEDSTYAPPVQLIFIRPN
jgi:hypothetical protein